MIGQRGIRWPIIKTRICLVDENLKYGVDCISARDDYTTSQRAQYVNPLTDGAVHIRFLHFILAHSHQLLNLLKIKSDIKYQQDLKFYDLHFVKSE